MLVRGAASADQALYGRVRGQTSDLALILELREAWPLEPTLPEQLAAARALGVAASAQIVVWFAREPLKLEVRVLDLAAERVLTRAIDRGEGELAGSAQDEAAALVVRSAARASLLGAALGTPEQELAEPAAPALVALEPPAVVTPVMRPVRPPRFRLGASGQGALAGDARFGLGLRAAVALAAFELGLRGAYGFGSRSETAVAEVKLAQHRAGLYAAYAPALGEWLELALELGLDMQVLTTQVRIEEPLFDGRAPRALLPGASAQLSVRVWLHAHFALALSAGVELLLQRPVLGYEAPQGFVPVREPWLVQPLLALELLTRF